MNDEFSLWDDTAAEVTAERTARQASLASAAVEPLWPYLSKASSLPEFEQRLALQGDALLTRVATVIEDPAQHPDHVTLVSGDLRERFTAALADREAREQARARENAVAAALRPVLAVVEKGKEVEFQGKTYVSTGEPGTTLNDGNHQQPGTMFYLKSDPTVKRAITDADLAKTSAKTATYYCTTHDVYVGDGNRDTHTRDSCNVEQRKAKESMQDYVLDYKPGNKCPYCGADSAKVKQTAKAGSPLTGVDRYKCDDCGGGMSDRSSHKDASKKTAGVLYEGPPHPDYPGMAWSAPGVEGAVMGIIAASNTPADAVKGIMTVLNAVGYDSMDREMAFWIASQEKGWDYEDLYDQWLKTGSKTAGQAGPLDRSAMFTIFLHSWPEFGSMTTAEGERWVTQAVDDWHASDATDMYAWAQGWLASLKDRATTASRRTASWIGQARNVVENKQHDGTLDMTTANMLVQVYDALGEANKAKFDAMPLEKAVEVAWKMVDRASNKTGSIKVGSGPYKAIVITPAGTGRAQGTTITEVTMTGLSDLQAAVGGYVEVVELRDGVTMWVNEEGAYKFGNEDVNWVAGDVAGLGGNPLFMLKQPILGPVVLTGHDPATGETTDVPEAGRRWCKRVGGQAGAQFKSASKTASGDYGKMDLPADPSKPREHCPRSGKHDAHDFEWKSKEYYCDGDHPSNQPGWETQMSSSLHTADIRDWTRVRPGLFENGKGDQIWEDVVGGWWKTDKNKHDQGGFRSADEAEQKAAAKNNGAVYDSPLDLPKPGDKVDGRGGMIGDDDVRDVTVVSVDGPYGPFPGGGPGGATTYHWDVKVDAGDGTQPYSQTWFTKSASKTAQASDECPECGAHMDDVRVNGDILRARCGNCGWTGMKKRATYDSSEEPCCYAFVTSGGQFHEPGCPVGDRMKDPGHTMHGSKTAEWDMRCPASGNILGGSTSDATETACPYCGSHVTPVKDERGYSRIPDHQPGYLASRQADLLSRDPENDEWASHDQLAGNTGGSVHVYADDPEDKPEFRGPTPLDYLMHGLFPSGASASRHTAEGYDFNPFGGPDWDIFKVEVDDEGQSSYTIVDDDGVKHYLDDDAAAHLLDSLTGHSAPTDLSQKFEKKFGSRRTANEDPHAYNEGYHDGYMDGSRGRARFNLQNNPRSSDSEYAAGYYAGFDAATQTGVMALLASATEEEWLEVEGAFFHHPQAPNRPGPHFPTRQTDHLDDMRDDARADRDAERATEKRHDEYWKAHPEEYQRHLQQNANRRMVYRTPDGVVSMTSSGVMSPYGYTASSTWPGSHQAVNDSAYGADRYQSLPSPTTPAWIKDAWDADNGPTPYLDLDRANPFSKETLERVQHQREVQAAAQRVAVDLEGFEQNDSFDDRATGQPLTTRPRVVPQEHQTFPTNLGLDDPGMAPSPVVGDPLAPTIDQAVAARVARLTATVLSENPTMDKAAARRLAAATVARYPDMVK